MEPGRHIALDFQLAAMSIALLVLMQLRQFTPVEDLVHARIVRLAQTY